MRLQAFLLCLCLVALTGSALADYPPYGKPARCPNSGTGFTITEQTPYVEMLHGQRIYFHSQTSAKLFSEDPLRFAPDGTDPVWDFQPNVNHEVLTCPVRGEQIGDHINGKSPRIQFRYGQSIYFFCYESINEFRRNPRKYIRGPGFYF